MFDKPELNYMHDMMDKLKDFVNVFYNPTIEEAYSYAYELKELLEGNEDYNELYELACAANERAHDLLEDISQLDRKIIDATNGLYTELKEAGEFDYLKE